MRIVLGQSSIWLSLLVLPYTAKSFSAGRQPKLLADARQPSSLKMFFANEEPQQKETESTSSVAAAPVDLVTSDNEGFLNMCGSFLVEAFWLHSPHHQLGDNIYVSDEARTGLMIEQCSDLQEKYGERLGQRMTKNCVVGALDPEEKTMLGVFTLKETLMIKEILDGDQAEAIAKNAVASLGPKERRQYKGASIDTIANELLSPDTKAVCVLSNLAVSPLARRRGIARTLCEEAEALASDWGYSEIHLLVESENTSARNLYEGKLGYQTALVQEDAVALRADVESGSFVQTRADTLVLFKNL